MYNERFLSEALQKAVTIVDTVEERYRDAAFPIILQSLTKVPEIANGTGVSAQAGEQSTDEQHESGLQQPLRLSVNEFFRIAAPDSHPGRCVCAAYYMLHTGKAEQFTLADILEIYGRLREPKPKNPPDVMNQCIRKAHITDVSVGSDKQKRWSITPSGEKHVEEMLHGNTTSKK